MKKILFISKIILIYLIFLTNFAYSFKNEIIANIGNEIISSYELKNKIKIILFLSNQEMNQNNINSIKKQAIRSLVEEKLKKEEILKFKIPIEKDENSTSHLNKISSKYNTDINGLEKIFFQNGLDFKIYLEEIYTQFVWNKLIVNLYKNKINIDEKEIEEELNRSVLKEKKIIDYNLGQIELSILNEKSKNFKQIELVQNEIKTNGFKNAAMKYSLSSSSIDGGNLGWVNSKSISPKILKILEKMKIKDVSEPIVQVDTILFLKLINKKNLVVDNINYNDLRKQIVLNKNNELLNLYSNNHLSKIKNNALIEIK
jgi:peptidyl-prolyl cis-trans isomerase SurA